MLVKPIILLGLLNCVNSHGRLVSEGAIRNEKEESFGDFISRIRSDRGRSGHLSENTKKSTLYEDQSLVVLSGCIQQAYELHRCQVKELAKLVENPPKPVCPTNFTHLASSNKCYKLEWDQLDWKDAGIRCRSLHPDAHLVVVDDADEQAAIVTYLTPLKATILSSCTELPTIKVWTAGQRIDPLTNSKFVWKPFPDTNIDMAYTNWDSGQPDFASNKESCVHFRFFPDLKWNDAGCDANNYYTGDGPSALYKQCPMCEIDLK